MAGWLDRWRRLARSQWVASAVLIVTVLAVLGTSPARWSTRAALVGPPTAAKGRGLELVLTSSAEPMITGRGPAKAFSGGVPCLASWAPATRMTCLLPPGTVIDDISIEGRCGGCTGPCVPPKGTFVTAESTEVDVWKDVATNKRTFTVPAHGKDFVATTFEVAVEGAEFIEVELEITDAGSGSRVQLEQQSCQHRPAMPTPYCNFLLYDSSLPKSPMSVTLSAKATGWGRCPAAGCSPPGKLRVVSIGARP